MKILIVGAGAVGGYFGGRLAEAGRDVTFLVRPRRADQIRQNGLTIISPYGDANLHPRLILASEITAPFDLILLSVKAYGLVSAIEEFAPAVGPATTILPLLNGMHHVDILATRFGAQAVVGGVCRVSTEIDAAGRILQLTDVQKITYGEIKGGISERMERVDQALRGAGFETVLSQNVLQDMWDKWVMLASLGAVTCLFRGTVGEVQAAPGGDQLARQILSECVAIAAASGYPPSEDSGGWAKRMVATPGSTMTSSMYRDMMAGGPVEADHILGDLIERGERFGIETPLLQAAYINLSVYQARLAS